MIHFNFRFSMIVIFCLVSAQLLQAKGFQINQLHWPKRDISLQIFVETKEISNGRGPLEVTAIFQNKGNRPFRILDGIFFGRPDEEYGEISMEIYHEGYLFEDWKKKRIISHFKDPDSFEVTEIQPQATFVVKGDIDTYYSLSKAGNYRMRAIFRPARVKGKKLSIIKPVYSNWIEVKVLEGLDK